MKPGDIVREFVAALESGDVDRAAGYLSDDFALIGLTPTPLSRQMFLDVVRGLLAAFPDWSWNLSDLQEDAGVVRATARVTGTHIGDLEVPVPELPAVRATGKRIALPAETHLYTTRGGKVGALYVLLVPGGGFQGLYRQIGARLPSPSVVKG